MSSGANITELGAAVASVNDWRAIMIFMVFVMTAQMGSSALQRWYDRKAMLEVAKEIAKMTEQSAITSKDSILHTARAEAALLRVEPILVDMERAKGRQNGN